MRHIVCTIALATTAIQVFWDAPLLEAQATSQGQLTPAQIKAASAYAEALSGGDDAAFTRAFVQAIGLGKQFVASQPKPNAAAFTTQNEQFTANAMLAPIGARTGFETETVNTLFDKFEAKSLRGMIDDPHTFWVTVWEGNPAKPDEFPDCVAIGDGSFGNFCCSGVLVSSNIVLTAAHCQISCLNYVYIGQDILHPSQTIRVANIERYQSYDSQTSSNDLTVLFLADMATNATILPIATSNSLSQSFSLRIVGFGMTNNAPVSAGTKCLVDVPIIPDTCTTPQQTFAFGCNMGIELVAGKSISGDSCFGDSGGPAYIRQGEQWCVAALTSREITNAPTNQPCGYGSVYLRLHPYIDWISNEALRYHALPPH